MDGVGVRRGRMAEWIESHAALREHPKRRRLSRGLGIDMHATLGLLHCLWWWAMDYAPDGDLSDFDPADVADGIGYDGDPKKLIKGLQDAGFMDGLQLHDWRDYGEKLHRRREANAKRMREAREKERKEAEKAAAEEARSGHVDTTCSARAAHVQDTCGATDRQTGQTDRTDLPKEDAAAVAREDEERSSIEARTSNPEPKPEVPAYLTDDDDPVDVLLLELWKVKGWRKAPKEDRAMLAQLGAAFPRADLATAIQQLRMKALDGAVETNLRSALQAFVKQLHLQTPEPPGPQQPEEPPPPPLTAAQKADIAAAMREAALLAKQGSQAMRL
jgi:hypothetical protein